MCLGFDIRCSKYQHSFAQNKQTNGSFHICFPSLVILGKALFVRHTTLLLCCNCLGFAKGHSSFIHLPTHIHIRIELKLTCLVVVFLLSHSLVRLSSGVDLLPLRLQQNACVSHRGMASDGSSSKLGSFSEGAAFKQSKLLVEVTRNLLFFISFSFLF